MTVEAINQAGAREGDQILLSFATGSLLKATFLLYIFPILCLIGGAALGNNYANRLGMDSSALSALTGFACFFVAVFFIKIKGNRMAKTDDYQPKIIRVIRRADES